MVGFAAVILGYTIKEGFKSGLEIAHPRLLIILSLVGIAVLTNALFIIRDTAGTSTGHLRGPTPRETASPLRRKSGKPAKKLKAIRFHRSASNY